MFAKDKYDRYINIDRCDVIEVVANVRVTEADDVGLADGLYCAVRASQGCENWYLHFEPYGGSTYTDAWGRCARWLDELMEAVAK